MPTVSQGTDDLGFASPLIPAPVRRQSSRSESIPRISRAPFTTVILGGGESGAPYHRLVIVRCVRIISPYGELTDAYPNVHVGGQYVVLEMYSDAEVYYVRILGDDGESPGALWDPSMFETVDPRIPTCWTMTLEDGMLRAAPSRWHRAGFWNDYFNRVPQAVADFEEGQAATLAESTRL